MPGLKHRGKEKLFFAGKENCHGDTEKRKMLFLYVAVTVKASMTEGGKPSS